MEMERKPAPMSPVVVAVGCVAFLVVNFASMTGKFGPVRPRRRARPSPRPRTGAHLPDHLLHRAPAAAAPALTADAPRRARSRIPT